MTTKNPTYYKSLSAWLGVVAGLLLIGLIATTIALINTSIALEKQQAILNAACYNSGSRTACKAGVKMLENMDIEDIEALGR